MAGQVPHGVRTMAYPLAQVSRTPRISCEAVPPSVSPAGAQGGTLSCRSGAALSFVSCIRLFGCPLIRLWLAANGDWSASDPHAARKHPS